MGQGDITTMTMGQVTIMTMGATDGMADATMTMDQGGNSIAKTLFEIFLRGFLSSFWTLFIQGDPAPDDL